MSGLGRAGVLRLAHRGRRVRGIRRRAHAEVGMGQPDGVSVTGPMKDDYAEILTEEALAFVAGLQRQFGGRRRELLERRDRVQAELDAGGTLDFLAQTPVSYTHLRAHETPEHLVCRLLLETKNKHS